MLTYRHRLLHCVTSRKIAGDHLLAARFHVGVNILAIVCCRHEHDLISYHFIQHQYLVFIQFFLPSPIIQSNFVSTSLLHCTALHQITFIAFQSVVDSDFNAEWSSDFHKYEIFSKPFLQQCYDHSEWWMIILWEYHLFLREGASCSAVQCHPTQTRLYCHYCPPLSTTRCCCCCCCRVEI